MGGKLATVGGAGDLALSDRARAYVRKSKAPNTLRTYRAALREYEAHGGAFPADPSDVIEYLTALADAGAKVSTIEVKLAALAFAHRTAGHADPTVSEAVKAVMAGIRRELRRAPAKREAATLAELAAMVGTLDTETAKGKRDRALLLVGFAGAFRRSELVALDVADLAKRGPHGADRENVLRVTVRQSKTDQEGEGQVKTIPTIGGPLCPVAALYDWLQVAEIGSGAVFRSVDRWGNVGGRLSAQSVALVVKDTAEAAGLLPGSFSGHSLRSGFITEAMDAGASNGDIMQQTGHVSTRVMQGYRKDTGTGSARAVRAAFGVTEGDGV